MSKQSYHLIKMASGLKLTAHTVGM